MKQCFILIITLLAFSAYTVTAQTSGPRKPPANSRLNSTETINRSSEAPPASTDKINTRVVNGLTITLRGVKGNAADQTVTLDLLITNPKGNARVVLRTAYAVDPEGDKYDDARGGYWSMEEVLYTDVPRKATIGVRGVPAKIKSLALFKFVVFNQLTNQDVDLEYRNLTIEW